MQEIINKLKKQINIQTEKRESKLREADETLDKVVGMLKGLWKNYYLVSLKGLDKHLIKTMTLEFNLPDDAAWQTLIIGFDYDGVKMYKKNPTGRVMVYDSIQNEVWLENAARAKVYNFVIKYPESWEQLLNDSYQDALIAKLESTLRELKDTAMYCLEVDGHHLRKKERQENKNKVYINSDMLRDEDFIKEKLTEKCIKENKKPIIINADNLYIIDEKRNPLPIKPEEITKGMYLYEQYMRYGFTNNPESMLRGLSYVEEKYCCLDKLVIISKEYVITNIDFSNKYETQKETSKKE